MSKMEPLDAMEEIEREMDLTATPCPWLLVSQHGRRGSSREHITPANLIDEDGKTIAVFTKLADAVKVIWAMQRVQQLEIRVYELSVLVNQLNGYQPLEKENKELMERIHGNRS